MSEQIYQPAELLFAIGTVPGLFDDKPMLMIAFTPVDYWKEEECMADFLGEENFTSGLLESCGISPAELSESQFEPLDPQVDPALLRQALLKAGFQEDPAFSKFLFPEA